MKRDTAVQNRKLTSLLALSAGAVALPQAGEAAIQYYPDVNQKVGFSSGFGSLYEFNPLPGTNWIKMRRWSSVSSSRTSWGVALECYNGTVRIDAGGVIARANQGATWNTIGNASVNAADFGMRVLSYGSPWHEGDPFTDKYFAFRFKDTTQGNINLYGWGLASMDISDTTGPDVTLKSWAYDDTGAKIAMGQTAAVPEPSTATLMALGALALGSRGVRRWRTRKQETAAL